MNKIEEMENLRAEKLHSDNKAERMVMEELLKMGFSYTLLGTYRLCDAIVISLNMDIEKRGGYDRFMRTIYHQLCLEYGNTEQKCATSIRYAIERAFDTGNINYLMETFKASYDYDNQIVKNRDFIMVMRKKIKNELEKEQPLKIKDLHAIIREEITKITDTSALTSICGVVMALRNGSTL